MNELEQPERRLFFDRLGARYAALRDDPDAWTEVEAERTAEVNALRDRAGWAAPRDLAN